MQTTHPGVWSNDVGFDGRSAFGKRFVIYVAGAVPFVLLTFAA